MFASIFGVSDQNLHIYLEKIMRLHDQHEAILNHLQTMNNKMLKTEKPFFKASGRDSQLQQDAAELKQDIIREVGPSANGARIDHVLIAMFHKNRHLIDKEKVKTLSEYLNGRMVGTLPSKVV